MTTFAEVRTGDIVRAWDRTRREWMPPVLVMENPHACGLDCMECYVQPFVEGRKPVGPSQRLHRVGVAEVRVLRHNGVWLEEGQS